MKRSAFLKIAGSSLILGGTIAGCASTAPGTHAASASDNDGAQYAAAAAKALSQDKDGKAIVAAEEAVAANPQDGAYRSLLGQAYLSGGRFASAKTSFEDALSLGHADAQTVIGLAMVEIARGKSNDARAVLEQHMEIVPASDYGFAMALAGDTEEGLRILSAEARQLDATARTRQNLAYTLALAGRWRESKMVASQDLSPQDAGKRVGEWAVLARPGAEAQQVAQLMGVTPQADPGQPVRLALVDVTAPTQMALASADPQPVPVETMNPEDIAPAMETQVTMAALEPAAPLVKADIPVASIPAPRLASVTQPVRAKNVSDYVVQLGAFSSAHSVNQAWKQISARFPHIRGYTTFGNTAKINGRTFYRLALSGFDSRQDAQKTCAALRAKGSACFVRGIADHAAPRWVSRETRQFAMR